MMFDRNLSPPFSRWKSKPNRALLAASLFLVTCLGLDFETEDGSRMFLRIVDGTTHNNILSVLKAVWTVSNLPLQWQTMAFGVFTVRFGKAPCLSGFPTKEHDFQIGNNIADISVHFHGMLQFSGLLL